MELFYGIILAFLEMTFLFVALLILHGLRKVTGSAGFYIALGLLFVFTQLVGAAGLKITLGVQSFDFYMSTGVLLLPCLTALMVVYVADGTLAAQRLIMGLMTSLGIYVYLANVTAMQSAWSGGMLSGSVPAETLFVLMKESMRNMAASVLSFTFDLFLIPIFYQRLRNMKCRIFVSVMGSLLIVLLLDSLIYSTIFYWGSSRWWAEVTFSFISRAFFVIWLSFIASLYIARIARETPGETRSSLDILIAFFGTYGRAKLLEQNLRETEEKYKILVQKASDMVIIMDKAGNIADANRKALKLCGKKLPLVIGKTLEEVFGIKPDSWENVLTSMISGETTLDETHSEHGSGVIPGTGIPIEISISVISLNGEPMLIAFGRDVSEKLKVEQEREKWRAEVAHKQRLESIGQLAGGIAHDFNNYLHAIQGHLDLIKYMYEVQDENVLRHLEKIDKISEQASFLTRQLLGFARKGKYNEEFLNLIPLVRSSVDLFMPNSAEKTIPVEIESCEMPEDSCWIRGDKVQLQQVFLNMMFNALDAMEHLESPRRKITIRIGTPAKLNLNLEPPPEKTKKNGPRCDLLVVRIEDTGCGIADTIKQRIFEPFFTTKPIGKGTGMGLSMAYGTIMAHNGWIQCENIPGGGAAFSVILPTVENPAKQPVPVSATTTLPTA